MLLGIDFGTRKIGLAVADESAGALPLAVGVYSYKDMARWVHEELRDIVDDYSVSRFIIGSLPEEKAGDSAKRQAQSAFENTLQELFSDIPLDRVDEQSSTKEAKKISKDNPAFSEKKDDAIAAAIILETYLAQHGYRPEN